MLAIAANKCDLEAERKVPVETIGSYAQEIGAKVFNTSAKTGLGLERVFEDIAKRILVQQHEDGARTQSLNRQGQYFSAIPIQLNAAHFTFLSCRRYPTLTYKV